MKSKSVQVVSSDLICVLISTFETQVENKKQI